MARNRFMTSNNPFIGENSFNKHASIQVAETESMTVAGAANKTLVLSSILIASAFYTYNFVTLSSTIFYTCIFGALILAIVSFVKPTIAMYTAPAYAVLEGVIVGGVSYMYAYMLGPGIIFNALMLTLLCLFSMLMAYKMGIIRATEKFRSFIVTATAAIFLIYMVNIVMSMFGASLPYLHQTGPIGIGISLFVIGIATLNLILDFDNIEKGAQAGAPKYMEWVSGLGLLVTLVWIYLEILRLLAMLSSRD